MTSHRHYLIVSLNAENFFESVTCLNSSYCRGHVLVHALNAGSDSGCYLHTTVSSLPRHSPLPSPCRSLGATIHEMATTKPPWGTLVPEAAMFQIGIGKSFPSLPEEVSDSLNDLYRKCLTRSVPPGLLLRALHCRRHLSAIEGNTCFGFTVYTQLHMQLCGVGTSVV